MRRLCLIRLLLRDGSGKNVSLGFKLYENLDCKEETLE